MVGFVEKAVVVQTLILDLPAALLLQEKGLDRQEDRDNPAKYEFYVSDLADQFQEFANSILPYDVAGTEQIDIEVF